MEIKVENTKQDQAEKLFGESVEYQPVNKSASRPGTLPTQNSSKLVEIESEDTFVHLSQAETSVRFGSEKSIRSGQNSEFKARKTLTQSAIKFADDLNDISRMPVTALRITSAAEEATLRKKTIVFMVLDSLIIINTILFIWISPIENERVIHPHGNNTFCPLGDTCKPKIWYVWCWIALPLSCLSLTMDALTLC